MVRKFFSQFDAYYKIEPAFDTVMLYVLLYGLRNCILRAQTVVVAYTCRCYARKTDT